MDELSIASLKKQDLLLFECISGSQAYGTQVEGSDIDLKGVYMAPIEQLLGLEMQGQINEYNNNHAYYELGKFMDLLAKSNPNMLEMLFIPKDCVLYKHPLMDLIDPSIFISKACKDTFAGYAQTQIKKARGLKKKMLNPVEPSRKTVLDFCFAIWDHHSMPLTHWLEKHGLNQSDCGLVNIPNAEGLYALFHSPIGEYKGIIQSENANEISYSSTSKSAKPLVHVRFNKNGYQSHCKEYKEYWNWVKKRNDERYQNTLSHGKRYDAKNMMHTFRLLNMALEIGTESKVQVRRTDRDFLLAIRSGQYEYKDLLEMAENKLQEIESVFKTADLPDEVDKDKVNEILVNMRKEYILNKLK